MATVAAEVRRRRKEMGWSAQDLADKCEQIGHPIPRNVIANMESGRRANLPLVDVMVLAAALKTPPICLIYPGRLRRRLQGSRSSTCTPPGTPCAGSPERRPNSARTTTCSATSAPTTPPNALRTAARDEEYARCHAADRPDADRKARPALPGPSRREADRRRKTASAPPRLHPTRKASRPPLPPDLAAAIDSPEPDPDTTAENRSLKGSTYRRCSCRDPKTGKELGTSCPKRDSRNHCTYSIRQELSPREDGSRRSFARGGYGSHKEAQADLDHVRALLGLAESDDPEGTELIAAMLAEVSREKAPLPEVEETRRRLNAGQDLIGSLTVSEWLDRWLAGKRIRKSGLNRYETDIRVHLKPRIGNRRLDRLRVSHLSEMFTAIPDANARSWKQQRPAASRCRRVGDRPVEGRRRTAPAARP